MNMKVVMIGAGNVATHLSIALKKSGFTIIQIFSKTEQSASQLAKIVKTSWTTNLQSLNKEGDIYIFALKDSILSETLNKIDIPNALFVHTAGSINISVFASKSNPHGVIYPLQTFSKSKEIDFNQVPLFIEGNNEETTNLLLSIAGKLSNKCFEIDSEKRLKLHLSAVFACNFANYMYTVADKIVKETELGFDILKPLIVETADKIRILSPKDAQTGPAVRLDTDVMEKHSKLLVNEPQLLELYTLISQEIYKNEKAAI